MTKAVAYSAGLRHQADALYDEKPGTAAYLRQAADEIERLKRELEEARDASDALQEVVEEWQGHGCGGDCLAEPCTHCDGTMYVEGKGKRLERELAEANEERAPMPRSLVIDKLNAELAEAKLRLSEAVSVERARCVALIPTTWLDPLLTGPTAVVNAPPYGCGDIVRLLNTIRERMEAPDALPEGWKLVPIEPTEAMHAAANREWDGRMSARSAGVWQAMLAAAPETPK